MKALERTVQFVQFTCHARTAECHRLTRPAFVWGFGVWRVLSSGFRGCFGMQLGPSLKGGRVQVLLSKVFVESGLTRGRPLAILSFPDGLRVQTLNPEP